MKRKNSQGYFINFVGAGTRARAGAVIRIWGSSEAKEIYTLLEFLFDLSIPSAIRIRDVQLFFWWWSGFDNIRIRDSRWKKFSWKIPFLALFAAPISDPGAALTAAPAIAVHVLLLLPRILSDQNPPPPGVYPDVPNFSIDSYDLAPNDQCDKDLFEANPVLDKPSYYCGSRTGQ